MCNILITRNHCSDSAVVRQSILDGMFSFRNEVFFQKLGWEVDSKNGFESDPYDDRDPIYVIAHQEDRVEGCWRFLRTTAPYMLKDTFPELLRGEAAPCDPAIWEISRFAVSPEGVSDYRQFSNHPITLNILRAGYEFARSRGVRQFVAVTSVAMERLLKRIGLSMRRFGDGKATRIGKTLSVAVWIDVDEHFRRAVYRGGKRTDYRMEVAA